MDLVLYYETTIFLRSSFEADCSRQRLETNVFASRGRTREEGDEKTAKNCAKSARNYVTKGGGGKCYVAQFAGINYRRPARARTHVAPSGVHDYVRKAERINDICIRHNRENTLVQVTLCEPDFLTSYHYLKLCACVCVF